MITLIIGVSTEESARRLRDQIGPVTGIEVVRCDPAQFGQEFHLDAEFLPVTAAERWGAIPISDRAQVLITSSSDQACLGVPKYIIAGGVLSRTHGAREDCFSALRAMLLAVGDHNKSSGAIPIMRVGVWEAWFGFDTLGPSTLAKCLVDSVLCADNDKERG